MALSTAISNLKASIGKKMDQRQWNLHVSLYMNIIDILLHQSGHIMLTDFDLSKGSSPPGLPGIVKSKLPHMVSLVHYARLFVCLLIIVFVT
jgi:hypothetical protein